MSRPRFLFTASTTASTRVDIFIPDGAPPGATFFRWRLIWSNNHELGRSADVFASLASCRAAVGLLQEEYALAATRVLLEESTNRWTWRLELDRTVLAARGRWYQRERECRRSLVTFLSAVPVALVAQRAVPTDARRHRALNPPVRSVR